MTDSELDEMILALASERWRKVAFVIGSVLHTCERSNRTMDEDAIARRVVTLVENGELEAQGNLARWRHSEVRLVRNAAGIKSSA
jgi:Protein of unknown function